MKKMLAHIQGEHKQTVEEHCRNTAKYAAETVENIGLRNTAYLAGVLHDFGKCKTEFQNYLCSQAPNKQMVVHSTQGLIYIDSLDGETPIDLLTKETVGIAVGSHHGFFDCVMQNSESGIATKKEREGLHYEECKRNYLTQVCKEKELEELYKQSKREITNIVQQIKPLLHNVEKANLQVEQSFYLGALERLVTSAVIEGDHRDTAEFMTNCAIFEPLSDNDSTWDEASAFYEDKIKDFDQSTAINIARRAISDKCKSMADNDANLYRLNVPTGSGKTLSTLRFALERARVKDKKRIIFVAPLLNILGQNAEVIKEFIGNTGIILEHHSNIVNELRNHNSWATYLKESWNSPVIITTFVQLLNTMFGGNTANLRRFHSLCDSIIIIDEIQSLPPKLISIFDLMCNFLSTVCNTTIVLCSATQPVLTQVNHKLVKPVIDMVPYDPDLWKVFERTKIANLDGKTNEQLESFIVNDLRGEKSVLLICNTKKEAAYFYETVKKEIRAKDANVFHLSASMCMQHREKVLKRIKQSLKNKRKRTVVISTQVMEAGVDISFSTVIRVLAGMDSIVQSAGRCNRNGEIKDRMPKVYVVRLYGESLGPLEEIRKAQTSTIALLKVFEQNPQNFDNRLDSIESIECYYQNFYGSMATMQDCPINVDGENTTLLDLLSCNKKWSSDRVPPTQMYRQSFRTAGQYFNVFDNDSVDVLVPFEKGKTLIAQLEQCNASKDIRKIKELLKKAKKYTVSIYDTQFQRLQEKGMLKPLLENSVWILTDSDGYDKEIGLTSK